MFCDLILEKLLSLKIPAPIVFCFRVKHLVINIERSIQFLLLTLEQVFFSPTFSSDGNLATVAKKHSHTVEAAAPPASSVHFLPLSFLSHPTHLSDERRRPSHACFCQIAFFLPHPPLLPLSMSLQQIFFPCPTKLPPGILCSNPKKFQGMFQAKLPGRISKKRDVPACDQARSRQKIAWKLQAAGTPGYPKFQPHSQKFQATYPFSFLVPLARGGSGRLLWTSLNVCKHIQMP